MSGATSITPHQRAQFRFAQGGYGGPNQIFVVQLPFALRPCEPTAGLGLFGAGGNVGEEGGTGEPQGRKSRSRGRFQEKASPMPLLYIVGLLIVVGVLLWLVNTYIPMDSKIKGILNAVVVIAVVIYLLQVFGLLGTLEGIRIGTHPVS
jgi:hypothetical protein